MTYFVYHRHVLQDFFAGFDDCRTVAAVALTGHRGIAFQIAARVTATRALDVLHLI